MKNEKDFTQFAQSVGKKLAEQAEKNVDGVLDEECLRVLF